MTPITLTPQEVKRALEDGKVILVRAMEPQPSGDPDYIEPLKISGGDFHVFERDGQLCDEDVDSLGHACHWKPPFGKVGIEFFGQEEFAKLRCLACDEGYKDEDCTCMDPPYYRADKDLNWLEWQPAENMREWNSRLTLIHTGTEVKQVDGIWKWFGSMEVKDE